MATINLYKIDLEKSRQFYKTLDSKMKSLKTIEKNNKSEEDVFSCTLYISKSDNQKSISWNWLLRAYDEPEINITSAPKAVLVIEKNYEDIYAITFGHAFFLVDKYCDKDFGFRFGRKLIYEEIKTTTLTTPGLQRNKVVNTYVNYNELEFDSGESFAKLKAKEVLEDGFDLYKPSLEIGSSIRFSTQVDSIETIIKLIEHVESVISTKEDNYKIPVFAKITDKDYIKELNQTLYDDVKKGIANINISELEIIGVTEVFNHNDSTFLLKFHRHEKEISLLNEETIRAFCDEFDIDFDVEVLNIKVVSYYSGEPVDTCTVKDIIDYTLDSEKCLLSKGVWYKYNDDYLTYLQDSLAEIAIEYHSEFDFSSQCHNDYIEEIYVKEKDKPNYSNQSKSKVIASLKKIHYAERAFNEIMARDNGFINYDRVQTRIGKSDIEAMDLYKDGCMYAVKIGNSSSKLCYAIDQSLTSLKMYKAGNLPSIPTITTVAIWLILERTTHIEDSKGIPQLNELDMLMLKNRLDQWKKAVRLQGFRPLIMINYRK